MKKAAFHNLGCKVNAYETEAMQQLFEENGFETVPFSEKADVYVVNTCTVTNMADRKSRQMLHRARKNNPDAVVIAAGCYVQEKEGHVDSCIDIIVGNNRKKDIIEILREYEKEHRGSRAFDSGDFYDGRINISHAGEYEELRLGKTAEHTRAYIKVQDGCNQFCSYCIIPYARGPVRSLPLREAAAEIGTVTLGGDPAGVSLGGERRWLTVYGPGGYCWRPPAGDKVLVLKAGAEGESPCVLGTVQGEAELKPGEVMLKGGTCSLRLGQEGLALEGELIINGRTLYDIVREIVAELLS